MNARADLTSPVCRRPGRSCPVVVLSRQHPLDVPKALSNAMRGKTFDDEDDMERWLAGFFESKPEKFSADAIGSPMKGGEEW
ncbi:unnamed protein product [Heligmosomoides polygyrus]|uniref:AbrB/MazE/SpoVT family DNA-binding domain-containing protein n=1 Tax=Heligmosomoides polygyrus TaxID=6339 RepID=A0A183FU70_HELPZ|nr:unnamed protein product [Heligmosomoides polygyrus]